jgi:arylsulfatase A-like enzyme
MTDGQRKERRVDRRTVLKEGLAAAVGLGAGGAAIAELVRQDARNPDADADRRTVTRSTRPIRESPEPPLPNILVIVVDQLRTNPRWLSSEALSASITPNIWSIAEGGVTFANHYTASNDCTPARSTLLTGLHTHQTGCMITGGSTLDPGFPTWGTMLRDHGYRTWWFGKWHLTHHDNRWRAPFDSGALERYGFSGGTYPSPDGGPGQGWRADPHIAAQFEEWYAQESGGPQPWCTTVSFVNPHDIAWWWRWSRRTATEATAPRVATGLPPNFETPEMLRAHRKPRLQHSLQDTAAASFGPVPFSGPEVLPSWIPFMDLYTKLEREVDGHVGSVLATLASRSDIAANTVVIFTSDHGEYLGSHGLRGKGAGAYEEAIRVPLIVNDPRGELVRYSGVRHQLTSSVDVAPLLLTIAARGDHWRSDPHYSHLATRADLASILASPHAPGRRYALHATDETVTEFATKLYAADAPLHVVAMRTPTAKLATYRNWEGLQELDSGEEVELYDYRTRAGRLELDNVAGRSRLEARLRRQLDAAVAEELHRPLPGPLRAARTSGFRDYMTTATHAAIAATTARLRRQERAALTARNVALSP